jgi:branched-chain amino acid transport system substrate-binding protein
MTPPAKREIIASRNGENRMFARWLGIAMLVALSVAAVAAAAGEKRYDAGATDDEIKLGQTAPLSGPVSSMAATRNSSAAYFKMINDRGGINGRKVNLIVLDDSYSPPKALEDIRRLVESDAVLAIFAPFGTATNMAFQGYLNQRKIPSLFISSATSRWDDPKLYPWTTSWSPSYSTEAGIYAQYLAANAPTAKIAVLKQSDDFGGDYSRGFRKALGPEGEKRIVKELSYQVSEPTIDSQMLELRDSGADALMVFATPKATVQALRKAAEMGWKPKIFITHTSHSVSSVMKPAGFANVQGVFSAAYQKDPDMPEFKDDPGVKAWLAWMDKYDPGADKSDFLNVYGYNVAQATVAVLQACGDDLTRANILKAVRNLDLELPMLLPGIRVRTSEDDPRPIKQMRMLSFEGENWRTVGDVVTLGR